jgi:hypothetical protein
MRRTPVNLNKKLLQLLLHIALGPPFRGGVSIPAQLRTSVQHEKDQ